MIGDREVKHRIAMRTSAVLIAAVIPLIWVGASAVHAQSIMRAPNFNIGSRTPNITVRVNPNVAGRTIAGTGNIAGRRAGVANIAGRNTVANTAVGRTTANIASTTVRAKAVTTTNVATTTRVRPTVTSRIAVARPTLPYVRYQPNFYPACGYAYRDSSGECRDQPISTVGLGGGANAPPQQSQNGSGPRRNAAQAAIGRRYINDQIIAEIDSAQADALARRHRLTRIGSQDFPLIGSALSLFRINDRRSVETVRTELAADTSVLSVHLNFRYVLQDRKPAPASTEGDPAQYALAKLRLPEAHALSHGIGVTVAVIDSGIDATHPELADSIADGFDALGSKEGPHPHGTGIAGAIVSHARLMGSAPAAKILAIRAFGAAKSGAESTSFVILKSLNFAASRGAQIVNMSFAGPKDPLVERGIAAAATKGMVLIAASGNAGPKSPPLYPAANSNVIAVSATDAHDKLFPASSRGGHIALAAPGVDIFLPAPDGKYQMTSGTSFSAAYISGLAALMLERDPSLKPDQVRAILMKTARDIGTPGRDDLFGAGEADAFGAVTAVAGAAVPVATASDQPPAVKVAEPQAAPATRDLDPAAAAIASEKPGGGEANRPAEQ